MPQDNDLGIYCTQNQKFYYLDTGPAAMSKNPVERILKILTIKGFITLDTDPSSTPLHAQYKVLKYKEARDLKYTMEALYLSSHIRDEAKKSKQTGEKPKWGRRASTTNE